jgi:hypothetical protein
MNGALDRLLLGARGEASSLLPVGLPHQIAGAPAAEGVDEGLAPSREARSPLPHDARRGPAPASEARSPQDARPGSTSVREPRSTQLQDPRAVLRQDVVSTDDAFAEPVREIRGAPLERSFESAAAGMKHEVAPEPADRDFPADEGAAERSSERAFPMRPGMRTPERAAAIEDIQSADAISAASPGQDFLATEIFVESRRLSERASATNLPMSGSESGRAAASLSSPRAPRLLPEIAAARESIATTAPVPPDRAAPHGEPRARSAPRPNMPPRSAAQSDTATRQGPQTQSPAKVQVTIGRVEVKAAPAAQPVRPRPAATQLPKLSLADYLKRRGSRSP